MCQGPKKVLSASRRTDIPAFYLDWFMAHIEQGEFTITNPYTQISRKVAVNTSQFHSIVFWSKNYDLFLQTRTGEALIKKGFNLYFNFTVNSESGILEPNLPGLNQRLDQMETLSNRFGSQTVSWRFDPICFYTVRKTGPIKKKLNNKKEDKTRHNNLNDFNKIADHAAGLGIQKCVTSFFDSYKKIDRRLARIKKHHQTDLVFFQPSLEEKREIIQQMLKTLTPKEIDLHLCCERELFTSLSGQDHLYENACIDGRLLKTLFGGTPEAQRDYGQRAKLGCGCTRAVDIGSYTRHPCFHNCLFCYANPDMDTSQKKDSVQ